MPAVLLELAFVTNPTEYRYLSSVAGQEEIASRLFNAFRSYKTKFDASVNVEEVAPKSVPGPKPGLEQTQVEASQEYYSIQIMGLGRMLAADDPALKGLKATALKAEGSSVYKYIYGSYATPEQAREALAAVREKFPEAFPVKVIGKQISRIR